MKEEDLESLSKRLEELERAYWLDNNPLVPDQVYNQLRKRYKELTGNDRPVGYEGTREKLPSPMYSLDNVYNEAEFEKWIRGAKKKAESESVEFIVEPKFDGISVSLLYRDGKLVKAFTRGNSTEGERIDDKLPDDIRYFPRDLDVKGEIEVRGEVIIDKPDFRDLTVVKGAPYTNPRQAAVGILRSSKKVYKNYLKFICFGIGLGHEFFATESDILSIVTPITSKFKTAPILYKGTSWPDAFKVCDQCCHKELSAVEDYPLDGAVIKINDIPLRGKLGHTSHHPRWAVAVKTQENEFETTLEGVEWGLGIQGTLTPVLLVKPVLIDGVTVSRVTGDNATRFNHAEYRSGDKLWIKRSGDVIPKVVKHEKSKKGDVLKSPDACPACGFKTSFNGAYLRCGNGFLCRGNTQARLLHFVSRDALDLKGFGQSVIEWCMMQYMESGSALLTIFRSASDHNSVQYGMISERFGEKIADKLISVCQRKDYPLHRVIYALAIPTIGLVTAKHLAYYVKDLKNFVDLFTSSKNIVIPHVYDANIENIKYWMDNPTMVDEVLALSRLLVTIVEEPPKEEGAETVCFTGYGDGFDRKMLEQSAHRAGYKVVKGVSKKLGYLVIGKSGASEKKIKEAQDKGVLSITVPEWIKKTT